MDRLETLNEEVLSLYIKNLIPSLKGNQVKNRLLDGSLHIQTIGEAIKIITFDIVSNDENMNRINAIEFEGEDVRVLYDDKYYIGKIDNLDDWREALFGKKEERYYVNTLEIAVSSEGII